MCLSSCGRSKTDESLTGNVNEKASDVVTVEEKSEKLTEKKSEEKTEKPTEETTEEVTEKPTEETTEKPTEETTEKPTEEVTEKQTEETTEVRREEPTEVISEDGVLLSNDASDFVLVNDLIPDIVLEIRYYTDYNFVGTRVDGYEEPIALLTREAAEALKEVNEDLAQQGYRLKIYDAYRPQSAVTHFVNWAGDLEDTKMKDYFYPELDKSVLFDQGYIAHHSGHSRGSTVDLTIVDMITGQDVDMGGTFDYFGERSHADYTGITDEQYANRMILRDAMTSHGFRAITTEWWHFTLENEPYPDTYFTFPVSIDSVLSAK